MRFDHHMYVFLAAVVVIMLALLADSYIGVSSFSFSK